jgi:DNA-binding transcriptional LysR family regulator
VRQGKKLAGVTAVGQQALPIIERIATELDNLSRIAARFAASGQGRLVIATTHNQASYVLPAVLADLARAAPIWSSRSARARRAISPTCC